MVTTTPSALSTAPGDAGPCDVADVLAALAGAAAEPFDRWDHSRADQVLQLAGWLQCATAWRTQDLHEPPGVPGPAHGGVVHGLIAAYQGMLARQRAEIAVFMYAGGTLKGKGYNDYDAVFDQHVEETVQMLGTVMAVLAGEYGRPGDEPRPHPDPQGDAPSSPTGAPRRTAYLAPTP
ncbi:hypothetical protein [Streptomyces kronopolitis]|uniref:hypothetical protein n=1 Tax=Streptomyces kronopolitis TaxID=1612435 RepID=UPI003D951CB7